MGPWSKASRLSNSSRKLDQFGGAGWVRSWSDRAVRGGGRHPQGEPGLHDAARLDAAGEGEVTVRTDRVTENIGTRGLC